MNGLHQSKQMPALIKHINDAHEEHLSYEHLTFENDQLFKEWMWKIERDVPCSFNKKRHMKNKNNECYKCSRSRVSQPYRSSFIQRKRKLKVQGRSYVGFTCPAHIKRYKMESGASKVQYLEKHFCNTNTLKHLGHIRLNEQDRKWFASKLNMGIPANIIIRQARLNINNHLSRRFLITKKDLHNIAVSFNIAKPERRHADDATSIETFVRSFSISDECPIILYKRQGDSHIDIGPKDVNIGGLLPSDFLLGYMDSSQCQMLKLYGAGDFSVICCDSTHGTNAYNFLLTTILILDSNREGFPVAFLFSNRETENILELFFKSIEQHSGQIHCQSFMSDMAQQSYNAWKQVMGDSQHRLYCAWHVDKAFRENIQRRVKDGESRAQTYKMLRTLMVEMNIATFETTKRYVLAQLHGNTNTAEFATYFESNYSMCAELWAYCYRVHCGVNTNMALERMHGMLKHNYLNGKKNKRLDNAMQSVIYLVQDKKIDRLLTLCRGKYTKKLSELRKRHETSLSLYAECIEISENREWTVQSSSDLHEFYNVTRSDKQCTSCELRCVDCRSCIHDFFCTCADMGCKYNMCKHIHYVCTKYPHTAVPIASENANQVHISEEDVHMQRNTAEADAHLAHLSRSLHTGTDLRDEASKLALDTFNLIQNITDNDELLSILDSLRAIRPRLEAVRASRQESEFIVMNDSEHEPYNKKIEPQRRFSKVKKERKNKGLCLPSRQFTKNFAAICS